LTPYLAGIPASGVSFSRDGDWVTYSTKPGGTIWRSKADGSERLQLTFPPMRALYPRWSPDGTRIAVAAQFPTDVGQAKGIYIVSRDGGKAELIAEEGDNPNWSPDGKTLMFRCRTGNDFAICEVDAATKAVRPVAGSQGFGEPSWSPDGRRVVVHSDGYNRLMLLDHASGAWRELAAGTYLFGSRWSRDSREVYYQDTLSGIDQPIFRVRVSDRRAERVGPAPELLPSDVVVWGLTGLTPDGYPLITLVRNNADIYALELK
jgi:Tol biopolymer transport system component